MSYRYIGNKTRLVPEILTHVGRLVGKDAVVADLMCGTASVPAALRHAGYTVVASDLMTYAVHHARVRLLINRAPRFLRLSAGNYPEVLGALQSLRPRKGLFFQEYSPAGAPRAGCPPRKYLTSENAAHIDAIRVQLRSWEDADLLTVREASLLRHDLIMAVNRVANIAGTYGHFRSTFSESALRRLELRATRFEHGSVRHQVFQGRAEDIAQVVSADLCYLDPPYMKRQYAANYHLIETLARGDDPEAIGASGLRDWWDQYSDFCSKRRLGESFAAILGKMQCSHFLISYSEDGLVSRDQLATMFGEFGTTQVYEVEIKRFRSNGSSLGPVVREYLFHVDTGR